jgi:hypothetical protein
MDLGILDPMERGADQGQQQVFVRHQDRLPVLASPPPLDDPDGQGLELRSTAEKAFGLVGESSTQDLWEPQRLVLLRLAEDEIERGERRPIRR